MAVLSNDISGKRFGKLFVINEFKKTTSGKTRLYCKCLCDCGNEKNIYKYNITSGAVNNCGCEKKIIKTRIETLDSTKKAKKFKNEFIICGELAYVKLKNTGNEMICDLKSWNILGKYLWIESPKGYAITRKRINGVTKVYFYHRFLKDVNQKQVVDHINQNKLDNRLENLRTTSQSMNCFNRKCSNESGYNGVSQKNGKWFSRIMVNGENIYLGIYEKIEDAIDARKEAEIKYRGEYSKKIK